ncbi:FAD-linked oxidoreductase hmp9 [Lecanicillium sp. MT-2017a]|nr:FAD-linked oxidoreductase hmp9 [Lecanicillium sp. MT-2017a]
MRFTSLLPLVAAVAAGGPTADDTQSQTPLIVGAKHKCRCVPGEDCWPSESEWSAFDSSLGGKLIKSEPIARSCYPGEDEDREQCEYVNKMWSDQDFQTEKPIGRPYPYNITCAPVEYDVGHTPPSTCTLGSLPTYAVNATTKDAIFATLKFAQHHNIRLAIASTGHDLLGRSDGYGSLEIWLRHYRNSIDFQKQYQPANGCPASKTGWSGSAIKIDGAWQWRDVHEIAKENKVIVVGGGSVSPGATGGWPSGGGHGPASRNYGLGADQILEAEVMLADGRIVIANHCQHRDLFRALRGGGPGFGIVLSTTVKVYDDATSVVAHKFSMAPLEKTEKNADLLDAIAVMLQAYPEMNDAGYAGYAFWFRNFPTEFIGNATSGYTHGIWMINQSKEEAEAAFAPVREALAKYKDKLFMEESFAEYTDYWSFYEAESGLYDPVGDTSLLTSRFVDPAAVSDYDKVRNAVEIVSGEPDQVVSNVVLLVSGGQVFQDGRDETSGLHPAWRTSPFALITGRGIAKTASAAERKAVTDDLTFHKGEAMKQLAPNTGGYMNEGDRHDPDYIRAFYGDNYKSHLAAKRKYDPHGVFYCPTCVGAERYVDNQAGALCRAQACG